MKVLLLNIVAAICLSLIGCETGEKNYSNPNKDQIRTTFSDIDLKLPNELKIVSLKRIDGLKGNYLEMVIDIPESESATLQKLFTTGPIPSKTDKEYPWYFTAEYSKTAATLHLQGRQFYD